MQANERGSDSSDGDKGEDEGDRQPSLQPPLGEAAAAASQALANRLSSNTPFLGLAGSVAGHEGDRQSTSLQPPLGEAAVAASQALANRLSSNTPFLGLAGQTPPSQALRLLRQNTGVVHPTIRPSSSMLEHNLALGRMSDMQAQSLMAAGPTAASLRDARLQLLLQQQEHQQISQQLRQQQQLNQVRQLQRQEMLAQLTRTANIRNPPGRQNVLQQNPNPSLAGPFASNINAQLAMSNLGAFSAQSRLSLPVTEANQQRQLSHLLPGGLQSGASLPGLLGSLHQQTQAAAFRPASPNLRSALGLGPSTASIPRGSPAAQLPAAQPTAPPQPAQDDQPEMGDAEYFELFGFNDSDGIQIINETFPHKLYRMLFEVETNGQTDIVSFFPHGKAFIVHQPKRFVEEIMPKYFSTSRMSSFQRQLNLYGFQRIDDGPEKGGFVHQFFQKGQRSLCNRIKRQRNKPQAGAASVASLPGAQASSASVASLPGTQALVASLPRTTSVASLPGAPAGIGRGSPQGMLQGPQVPRGGAAAAAAAAAATSAAAALPTQMSLPQSQQAQILLQQMLNEQEERNRNARNQQR